MLQRKRVNKEYVEKGSGKRDVDSGFRYGWRKIRWQHTTELDGVEWSATYTTIGATRPKSSQMCFQAHMNYSNHYTSACLPKVVDYSAQCASWQQLLCCRQQLQASAAHLTLQPLSTQLSHCDEMSSATSISRRRMPRGNHQHVEAQFDNVYQCCNSFFSRDTS